MEQLLSMKHRFFIKLELVDDAYPEPGASDTMYRYFSSISYDDLVTIDRFLRQETTTLSVSPLIVEKLIGILSPTFKETITLTFGDQAESHAGMQKIGQLAERGFTLKDLECAHDWFSQRELECELYHLNDLIPEIDAEPAYLLVVRYGVAAFIDPDDLLAEQNGLVRDTKAWMKGGVKNKIARHNLCFGPEYQAADFEHKKGTIIAFESVPLLSSVRDCLPLVLDKCENLMIEANYYYDPKKCYIGQHGDAERRLVIGVRLGAQFAFHYQWYFDSRPIGSRFEIDLHHGDLYIMSTKAVGTDWLKKKIPTLRHAAGPYKLIAKK